VVISLLENDLGASLLFVFVFLSAVFALPLLLAWLERPHQTRALQVAVRRTTEAWRARRSGSPGIGGNASRPDVVEAAVRARPSGRP
jgi:hypothetical protein